MSSVTYNSASTFVDAHASRDTVDDFELNNHELSNTSFGNNNLSPYQPSQTLSNTTSPSNNPNSTPGDSFSEYSNLPSDFEFEDEFFGVDFDAGAIRIDSFPTHLTGQAQYQPDLNRPLPDLPAHIESKALSDTFTVSTYPLSPVHTSIPNTPSPRGVSNDIKHSTNKTHVQNDNLYNTQFHNIDSTNTSTLQLTPDQSGSSHTSEEGLAPSTMAGFERSPQVTVSQWNHGQRLNNPGSYGDSGIQYTNVADFASQLQNHDILHTQASVMRAEDGSWRSNDRTGQAGFDPESRRLLSDELIPTLDEQEERRRIQSKNIEVQEWASQAGGSSAGEEEQPGQSYFSNNQNVFQQSEPRYRRDPTEDNNIPPVSDAPSIHENQLQDGQVYYDTKNPHLNEIDLQLMNQSRHWHDGPALPYIMTTSFQPQTANDAISQFKRNADTISIASRAATWGTRRRSEPSLADFEAVANGSFLKKLSISKSKEGEKGRHNSLFDQGLDRLAKAVRKRSNSGLKRSHSSQNIPEEPQSMTMRQNSHGLVPPLRTPSFGKLQTPSINTTLISMGATVAAVGATHTHNRTGSISASANSPKSPIHLGFSRGPFKRNRSKSELTSQEKLGPGAGIIELWRGQGGPPVPTLASPPVEIEVKQPDVQDNDEDDDEDDEQGDEGDMKMESEEQSDPIIPNYEGFKAHVRRLNPDMDTMGGNATLLDPKGNPREIDQSASNLQLVTDFSDNDSNPGEGALTEETFPQGVPMPPTRNLPAEFECQLCFKAKKFQKPSDWTKHVHEDVQPFTCTYDKCKEPKSFKRKADWVRHENERHRHLEWWICQVDDCRHPCYRKDNFLQHLVREHKLPEPKQKTKAAIKKARLTEPAWRMLEQCHHETTNRPQDEPCKFCGRTFATWKKLTVHLAKHMEHISLPVLKLVEARNVDANTIISPVEQNLTPITPDSRTKLEPPSPFPSLDVSPLLPMNPNFSSTGFDQGYFPVTAPSGGYAPMTQDVIYPQNPMYQNPNTFTGHHTRNFGSMDSNSMGHVNQNRGFDTGYSQPKVTQSRGLGSMDANFPQHIPNQAYSSNQIGGYSMAQDFTSAPPAVSNYPTSNMLSVNDAAFGFDPMAVSAGQNYQQISFAAGNCFQDQYIHSQGCILMMREILLRLFGGGPSRDTYLIIGSSVATTLAVVTLTRLALSSPPKTIIRGPTDTLLPKLSKEEQAELPYPPDVFPGSRDVVSPYGTCRVYEWGPEDGRKVFLCHGISTPCVSLGGVANALVEKGCRVMLMDLWGRGYSDSPDLPHDSRLYTTQILLAITSSPLAWSSEGFSVIGYSLGGGIAADFAAYFPNMISNVVLLAPSGLIRKRHFGWQSKIMYSGILSENALERLGRWRLTSGLSNKSAIEKLTKRAKAERVVVAKAVAEHYTNISLSKNRPNITVASTVSWQIAQNHGFVRSFVSSLRYASIAGSEETWKKLAMLREKVIIFVGSTDEIIVPEELHEDAKAAIGGERIEWRVIEGGHEFPITHPDLVAKEISQIWGI
ncbi:hypothetical protein G7Y89_g5414 [Cudoniella acicularis]|uniref:C2H2-type domain-containing protein n=1 Tax=Cudoniella acicularis TaxID=354080 RepID=A0A8H4RPM1_9HELO|nr:hypothetical protein G7Y89_g5414 [Cudoniella acicularis]